MVYQTPRPTTQLQNILQQLRAYLPEIKDQYQIKDIRVFGSYARGEQTPDSDLDLLIDLKQEISLLDRIALKQELEDLLGVTVDIAKPENLHEIIREQVLEEAIPL